MRNADVHFRPASDQSLLISFDSAPQQCHRQIVALLRALEAARAPAIRNLHPAYRSLLIRFDPLESDHAAVQSLALSCLEELPSILLPEPALVEIPVCYGGEFGPDLADVASLHNLSIAQVIELHASIIYTVYFLGFVPGFAYLGDLPDQLNTPRLPAPRKQVARGSVGIAGNQTGVYPCSTPGGWRLIGRTLVEMFRPDREQMSLLSIGDRVRFLPAPPR